MLNFAKYTQQNGPQTQNRGRSGVKKSARATNPICQKVRERLVYVHREARRWMGVGDAASDYVDDWSLESSADARKHALINLVK